MAFPPTSGLWFQNEQDKNQQELLHKGMHNKIHQVPFMDKFNLCTWISHRSFQYLYFHVD